MIAEAPSTPTTAGGWARAARMGSAGGCFSPRSSVFLRKRVERVEIGMTYAFKVRSAGGELGAVKESVATAYQDFK